MEERHQQHERDARDAGQALPLVVLVLTAAGAFAIGLSWLGSLAAGEARAATAADAAALAGAGGGAGDAHRLAAANGGQLTDFARLPGGDVRVEIEMEGTRHRASARARRRVPAASPDARGLAPAMRAAIARAEQLLGKPIPITSGYRSASEQARLWNRRATNPYPVAAPGSSKHELGLAIDVPASFAETLAKVGRAAGLCRPFPAADPVHFELCGDGFTGSSRG
ncbi:MAG TPA: M15 family metallopeptidase [Acidimicrobiales bacterium]|nr:M15 family metallopeptidase [Acidimicrobiales bacterium]